MKLLDRIFHKITPTNEDRNGVITQNVENNLQEKIEPNEYHIPVNVGEYFPWKGHVFQVVESRPMQFTAVCKGITRNRADKLGLK